MFGREYVVSGKFAVSEGKLYSQLQSLREESDYNCHFSAGPEIQDKVILAQSLITHIGQYIGYYK